MALTIHRVPVWSDNYAWVLEAADGTAAVVDSPEAAPIAALLRDRCLRLTHILNTHHHPDHVGANRDLATSWPGLHIWAGRYDAERERIPGLTRSFSDGERAEFGGVPCTVRAVPGHTLGHIAWLFDDGAAFVGDTLFVGGCGRLFEGTARQLDHSLHEVLGALDPATRLYCAHEYTAANLRFALSVEPDNADLLDYAREVERLRAAGTATVPSTLELEWRINPYLRCDRPELRLSVGAPADAPRHEVLGALRAAKDRFPG
jgi:hydroxyacylglutathione hydrolase